MGNFMFTNLSRQTSYPFLGLTDMLWLEAGILLYVTCNYKLAYMIKLCLKNIDIIIYSIVYLIKKIYIM